jgi:hypothetical protein
MITAAVNDLLAAWSDHQITARELVTESRQLTAEDRALLRAGVQPAAVATNSQPETQAGTSDRQLH